VPFFHFSEVFEFVVVVLDVTEVEKRLKESDGKCLIEYIVQKPRGRKPMTRVKTDAKGNDDSVYLHGGDEFQTH
jgi:hypothetical protein